MSGRGSAEDATTFPPKPAFLGPKQRPLILQVFRRKTQLLMDPETDARRKMKRSFSTLLWRSIKATTSQRHFRCRIGLSTRSSKATHADSNHRANVSEWARPNRDFSARPGKPRCGRSARAIFFSWFLGLAVGLLFYASLCKCVNV